MCFNTYELRCHHFFKTWLEASVLTLKNAWHTAVNAPPLTSPLSNQIIKSTWKWHLSWAFYDPFFFLPFSFICRSLLLIPFGASFKVIIKRKLSTLTRWMLREDKISFDIITIDKCQRKRILFLLLSFPSSASFIKSYIKAKWHFIILFSNVVIIICVCGGLFLWFAV